MGGNVFSTLFPRELDPARLNMPVILFDKSFLLDDGLAKSPPSDKSESLP